MPYAAFTPYQDVKQTIIDYIAASDTLIAALFYVYADGDIHDALLAAQARHGTVYAIFDRRQLYLENPRLLELQNAGIPVLIDNFCRSVRSQYLVIDDYFVLSGSYLYTHTFDAHYASSISITFTYDTYLAYLDDWLYHYDHAVIWT